MAAVTPGKGPSEPDVDGQGVSEMFSRIANPATIEFKLPAWGRLGILFAIVVASLFLTKEATRVGMAALLGDSAQLPELRRAAALDPASPEIHHQLGMAAFAQLGLFSPDALGAVDPNETIRELQRAVELSPRQAPYWSNLASACEALGDQRCADLAVEQALKLGPTTPRYQWLAANRSLRKGNNDQAMARFMRLLSMDSSYASATFEVCLLVVDDPEELYAKVVPSQSDLSLRMAYVYALMDRGKPDFAYRIWTEAVAHATDFPFAVVQPFVDRLIDSGQSQEAQAVWLDLLRRRVVTQPPSSDPLNLIFNGDFEQIPLDAGFDWRYQETPYVTLDFGDLSAFHNSHCLRMDFTVSRDQEFEPVFQWVGVEPDQTYLLSAYVRSDAISSDTGPRLRVVDPFCPSCLDVSTDSTAGTTEWHRVSVNFSTKSTTRLVKISVWRPQSRTFPKEIAGTFRLDYVLLRPISSKPDTPPEGTS